MNTGTAQKLNASELTAAGGVLAVTKAGIGRAFNYQPVAEQGGVITLEPTPEAKLLAAHPGLTSRPDAKLEAIKKVAPGKNNQLSAPAQRQHYGRARYAVLTMQAVGQPQPALAPKPAPAPKPVAQVKQAVAALTLPPVMTRPVADLKIAPQQAQRPNHAHLRLAVSNQAAPSPAAIQPRRPQSFAERHDQLCRRPGGAPLLSAMM